MKHFISPYVYVGYGCNNNCVFCSEADEYFEKLQPKSLDQVKEEIQQVRDKYDFISLMGREPTLRQDLLEIIRYAKTLGFRQISLTTNGRMLSYPGLVRSVLKNGVNQVGFSINASYPELHDKLSGVRGSFEQTVEGIKNVIRYKDSRTSVLVNVPLNKINYEDLEQIINLLISLGVKEINILWTAPLSKRSRNTELIADMSLLGGHVVEVLKKFVNSGVKFLMVEFLPCSLPRDSRKFFFPCLEKNPNKKRIKLCENCDYREKCDGVLEDYLQLYGEKSFKL